MTTHTNHSKTMTKVNDTQSVTIEISAQTIGDLRSKAEALRKQADELDKVADKLEDVSGEVNLTVNVW